MVSTESVRPTKGNLRSAVVCDCATMDVMRVWRSECFLRKQLVYGQSYANTISGLTRLYRYA
jgi:hypothetical protein